MAKKTPVKKSKRGLKRSVRRSLSAVLMITAIGVAAIPVPENFAAPEISLYADATTGGDRHADDLKGNETTPEFKFNPYEPDNKNTTGDPKQDITVNTNSMNLSYYADDDAQDMIKNLGKSAGTAGTDSYKPEVYASLGVTPTGSGFTLGWRFLYYYQGDAGVICKYNDLFFSSEIDLDLYPTTEYFAFTETDITNYFTESNWSLAGGYTTDKEKALSVRISNRINPIEPITYTYAEYKQDPTARADEILEYYFEDELRAQRSVWAAWSGEEPPTGDAAKFERKPINISESMREEFFAEQCVVIQSAYLDKSYTVTAVVDNRPNVTPGRAFLVRGGNITNENYHRGDCDFLVVQTTYVPMVAIGDKTFKGVENVEQMNLDEQLKYIGNEAFMGASLLQSITLKNVSVIGNRAFKGCVRLRSAELDQATAKIGQEAFSGLEQLETLKFGVNLSQIGYGAFNGCTRLRTVTFESGQQCEVGDYAFYNCISLTSVAMENSSVMKLGNGAFAVSAGGQEIGFVLPKSINMTAEDSIGNYLFAGRSRMQYVVFPSSYGTTSPVTIPDSVFHGCTDLQYVEFPCTEDARACGYVRYNPILFADVANKDFYVRGPELNQNNQNAYPRTSTWDAITAYHDEPGFVPYLYIKDGVEYYEICSGDYLECIRKNPDGTGTLISCKLKPGVNPEDLSGTLIIPDKVGDTVVVAIDTNCFSDTGLTASVKTLVINDNIKEIADSTFANIDGKWNKLEKATIGSSVEKLGANAFLDCTSLTDITFKTPIDNDYTKLQFPDSALQTKGNSLKGLTIHGDIVEGYRPFEYAINPEIYAISKADGRRVCYQSRWDSPSSKHMTVMYGESSYSSTGLVTLLDYPKYSELEDTTGATGAELADHNGEREQQFYENYAVETYDDKRIAFVKAWQSASSASEVYVYDKDTGAGVDINGDPLYGPWINEDFCNNWSSWVARANETGKAESNGIFGWLFEPITAYALDTTDNVPAPYFETYPFNFMTNYKMYNGNESLIPRFNVNGAVIDYMGWNDFEREIIRSVEDIIIPEGVESIDVYDYYMQPSNKLSFSTYLPGKSEYISELDEDKGLTVVPGLFSGLIKDYEGEGEGDEKKIYEARGVNGNDRIRSVTMSSVLYLPDYAFDNCERLVSVTLGDAMQQVGALPFRDCNRLVDLTGNAKYPAENGILYETQNGEAEAYKIVECLLARGAGSPLSDMVVSDVFDSKIPFVSAIAKDAFADCDNVNTINLYPSTLLTEILDGTFKDCDNLALVTLPASVNDIHDNAFADVCKESTLNPRCQIYIYGSEVSISDNAFGKDSELPTFVGDKRAHAKERIKIWAYDNTAAARYAKYYSKDGNGNEGMLYEAIPASESAFSVIFMDYDGTQLGNTQFVINDKPEIPDTTELKDPNHRPGYRFNDKWLGTNGQDVDKKITDNCIFFAQYESDGTMVNGKYVVEFRDGIDGRQLNNIYAEREDGKYHIEPRESFMSKGWEAPPYYAHEGYKFLAWSNNWTENTVIEENMTIIALYEADNTGGSGGSSGVVGGSSGTTQTTSNTSNKNSSNSSSSTSSSSTSTGSTTSGSSEVGKYTVTVENGSGSGSYDVGSTVIIAANTAPAGMVFKNWTTESNGVALASVSMTATTFTMPANNVTVTANYVTATPTAANTGSTGSVGNTGNTGNTGNRDNGSTRVDITKPGISNKDLATANTNGSTDNFVVKITETDEATRAVADALTNKYGSLENILYYAMDISLYDSTGTVKISDTSGLSVDITIPIPDALVAYGGNNMAGAVINGNQLENLNENFTTINGVPCIRFTATHFSPYTIYVDTGNLTEGMLDVTPKTGDPIHPKWFLSIGLACLSVILFMKKDKAVKVKTA